MCVWVGGCVLCFIGIRQAAYEEEEEEEEEGERVGEWVTVRKIKRSFSGGVVCVVWFADSERMEEEEEEW